MAEKESMIGLGLALLDAKTWNQNYLPLPSTDDELLTLLDRNTTFLYSLGGVVSNVLTAYSRFTGTSASLVGCIGNDSRGLRYQQFLDSKLGQPQICRTEPTGVVTHILNQDGFCLDKRSFYGAARKVTAPIESLRDNPPAYFITNAAIISMPEVFMEAYKVLTELRKNSKGLFILNCGGTRPNRTSKELLLQQVGEYRMNPDIIIGNETEMCYLAETNSADTAIERLFPESRIVIITQAEKGSIVRFAGNIFPHIPAYPTNTRSFFDCTGTGDCYLGVWLGALSEIDNNKWTKNDIYRASCTAAFAAACVFASPNTQLNEADALKTRSFYTRFKTKI